jgi:hypothetical protein
VLKLARTACFPKAMCIAQESARRVMRHMENPTLGAAFNATKVGGPDPKTLLLLFGRYRNPHHLAAVAGEAGEHRLDQVGHEVSQLV